MNEEVHIGLQSLKVVRERRAASIWTRIHPLFAIAQLLVFLVSVTLLVLHLLGIVSFGVVHVSVLVKIGLMLGAIVTGALWEHDVFGKWWFASEFFIEDTMTLNVFLLHVAYLVVVYAWPENTRMILALLGVAYTVYGLNVAQYILRYHGMREPAAPDVPVKEAA